MSKRRTITITLTEPQYKAIADAVAHRDSYYEGEEYDAQRAAEDRARDAAWIKIRDAWWAAERKDPTSPKRRRAPEAAGR